MSPFSYRVTHAKSLMDDYFEGELVYLSGGVHHSRGSHKETATGFTLDWRHMHLSIEGDIRIEKGRSMKRQVYITSLFCVVITSSRIGIDSPVFYKSLKQLIFLRRVVACVVVYRRSLLIIINI
jgi:hypothetical protein